MTTFITRLDASGSGPRLAVKDLIDVEGVPTTAGSRAVERGAKPAEADASCLRGARAAGRAGDAPVWDEPVVRHTRQPARPGADPRRLVERFGGRGRQ
ncbi:MAG: hypothetical protein E6G17_10705 [Actinobacteria bacterium]|nr:MAG: hypothetical protein E6G17_10705 [Actinomycetota bacterium]